MDMEQVRKLYDEWQRINVDYPRVKREVTPRTVRLIDSLNERGTVIYSSLDEKTADETIRAEIAHFRKLKIADDFEWKLFDYDLPGDLKARLLRHGFAADEPEAVLVLDMDAIPDTLLRPVTQDVRRITDTTHLNDVAKIQQAVWGEAFDWLIPSLGRTLRDAPQDLSVYIAYVEGDPVSAGWIDYHDGNPFAGLWGGATLPQYRQRGLYTALVAARVQEARARGVRFVTIDASPMSRPTLEKLGFQFMASAWECIYGG